MPVPVTFEVNVAPETLQGTQGSQREAKGNPRAEQPGQHAVMLPTQRRSDARFEVAGTQVETRDSGTRHEEMCETRRSRTDGQARGLSSSAPGRLGTSGTPRSVDP